MNKALLTRRNFLQTASAAAITAALGDPLFALAENKPVSRVVLIRNKNVVDADGTVNPVILEQMFDDAVASLFKEKNSKTVFQKIVKPADIVGIKTNAWKYLRTPPELEQAVKTRLMNAGVEEKNIAVDDRSIAKNPIFQNSTALINIRPMRAHNWSGVGGCLKNYIMFSPKPSSFHSDSCIDLGAIWNFPEVKGKTKLNILLMLTPQFNCLGPHHFDKESIWHYNGLLASADPVAVDAVGLRIIEQKRHQHFKEETPVRPAVTHIEAAEKKHGVGISDLGKIEIVKMGWTEGILI